MLQIDGISHDNKIITVVYNSVKKKTVVYNVD